MSLFVSIKKDFGSFFLDIELGSDKGVLGILGASGSGKSMTLRCIAGIEQPDEGQIVLNGKVLFDHKAGINLSPQKRGVGYLFQSYGLFPYMTVEQNILCGLCRERGMETKKKKAVAEKMMKKLMLSGLEKRRPNQLSGGQQQRVALARIFVGHPEILLLDEPFSALDAHLRLQLQMEMKHLLDEFGKDVVLVSHSRDELYRLCDTLAVVDEGKVLEYGGTKEKFASPMSFQGAVLTGCKNIVEAKKAGEYAVEVPAWGMRFSTEKPVGENLRWIGIRAHYFHPEEKENRGKITLEERIEEPFAWIVKFRYEGADPASETVWWRLAKETITEEFPKELGISPGRIMLLYQ